MNQILPSGEFITLVHLVHSVEKSEKDFTENAGEGDIPLWKIACMPNMREFHSTQYHPNYQRTDDYRAVTCPACKETDAYKQLGGR